MKRIAQQTDHRARPARGGREAPAPWGGGTGAAGFAGKGVMTRQPISSAQEGIQNV